jgi:hypothetical protein
MNKLIKNIAKGENLDFEMLKEKYLNTLNQEVEVKIEINKEHETEIILDTELDNDYISQSSETKSCEEIIFDKVVIDGTNYYYENKDNGRIYDSSSKIVGIYKNNLFLIN